VQSWEIDAENFTATPVLGNGAKVAPLSLLAMFEAYNRDVEGSDADAAIEQMRNSTASLELELARIRAPYR
jgi:hypothetical protein